MRFRILVPCLIVAFSLAFFVSPAVAEDLNSLKKEYKSAYNKRDKIAVLDRMAELGKMPGQDHKAICRAISKALSDKDLEVGSTAAELLAVEHLRPYSVDYLTRALGKYQSRHKSLVQSYFNNLVKLIELIQRDESKSAVQDLERMLKTLRQFQEATKSVFEKLEVSRTFVEALTKSIGQVRDDRSVKALKSCFRSIKKYSNIDTVPPVQGLLALGSRSAVETVIKKYEEYDYAQDQSDREDYEELELEEPWTDWGEKYNEAFTDLAKRLDLDADESPEHGQGVQDYWIRWFEKHKEKLPLELGSVGK